MFLEKGVCYYKSSTCPPSATVHIQIVVTVSDTEIEPPAFAFIHLVLVREVIMDALFIGTQPVAGR